MRKVGDELGKIKKDRKVFIRARCGTENDNKLHTSHVLNLSLKCYQASLVDLKG
jgi:hypothetical protein